MDDFTYETWHDIIGDLDFDAARNAVIAVKHSQPFVDPSDIIAEVKRAKSSKPYERTAAEAIAESTRRELDAGPTAPPNEEYRQAKQKMLAECAARDAEAMAEQAPHPPVPVDARLAAYAVKCPWCEARPGTRCVNTVLDTPKNEPHSARVAAARLPAA